MYPDGRSQLRGRRGVHSFGGWPILNPPFSKVLSHCSQSERAIAEATVDGEYSAGYVGGGVAGEVHRRPGDLLAVGHPAEGRPLVDFDALLGPLGVRLGVLRRDDEAGAMALTLISGASSFADALVKASTPPLAA